MAKGRHRRETPPGPYVTLREYMLRSPAWRSLDCVDRCLYVETVRRWRGPDTNNGKIPYGAREAAKDLGVSKNTANRSFWKLQDRGFLIEAQRSGFNMKGRTATEWLLTEFPDDRAGKLVPATKDFMRWKPPTDAPEKSEHSPISDRISPTTGTTMH
jgi:hypothetical protein